MLLLLLTFAVVASRDATPRQHTFTDEDLARVSPLRAETGGSSTPVEAAPTRAAREPSGAVKPGRESYWRRESHRVREKVRVLEDRAVVLRQRVEERRRKPGVRPYSDEQIRRWEEQALGLLARGREMEMEFLDRARREGALPGWLR